jgi:hypothetical protein
MTSKLILWSALTAFCLGSIAAMAQEMPSYKPPSRGAPGGRVSGASRSGPAGVTIELISPESHTGLTASASPTLYYFVSQAANLPITLAIRAPNETRPLVETSLTPPRAAGIYAIGLAGYRAQLQPNVLYTWSVSETVDPQAPSNDIVASATIMRVAADPAVDAAAHNAPPVRRAAIYAQAGLWYEAVAAAFDASNTDGHAAFDALLDQVGLQDTARFDRGVARGMSPNR